MLKATTVNLGHVCQVQKDHLGIVFGTKFKKKLVDLGHVQAWSNKD
jgi:hypothetical protein